MQIECKIISGIYKVKWINTGRKDSDFIGKECYAFKYTPQTNLGGISTSDGEGVIIFSLDEEGKRFKSSSDYIRPEEDFKIIGKPIHPRKFKWFFKEYENEFNRKFTYPDPNPDLKSFKFASLNDPDDED